jgi:hypothetical protein
LFFAIAETVQNDEDERTRSGLKRHGGGTIAPSQTACAGVIIGLLRCRG